MTVCSRVSMFSLALALVASCSSGAPEGPRPPQEGHAFLSIVGEAALFVEGGGRQTITVQYHDEEGHPLVGDIAFDIFGDPRGGDLSAVTATTDAEGLAHIDVVSGEQADFQVTASALYAQPVQWNVSIGEGGSALDATGAFQLESEFDIADGIPGPVGAVINAVLDMTDDPNDPATWVIDQLLTQINNDTITNAIAGLRPGLDVILHDALVRNTPEFVEKIINVGDDLEQVARHFGSLSTFTVGRDPDLGLVASHGFDAFRFSVEGVDHEYTMSELELEDSKTQGIKVSLRGTSKLGIAEHQLPVHYGHMIAFVLDHAIIPAIDPSAHNLGELLPKIIDCAAVGQVLSTQIGVGPPVLYEIACNTGLAVGGALIEKQLESVEAQAQLTIAGDAKPKDGGDGKIHRLDFGQWEGQLAFPAGATKLKRPKQKFTGDRQE
jgi:hypothetical protein